MSTSNKNSTSSRKHGCSDTDKDNKARNKGHVDVNVTIKDLEFPSDLQDEPEHDKSLSVYQTSRSIPRHLIELMYRLDLSTLCSYRKSVHEYKYPSLSLEFQDTKIDKFNNIILRNKKKSVYIQIENVDKYYIDNDISYARLFTKEKEKRSFFINDYFDSFVRHLIPISNSLSNIKYLVIYTNAGFDLTEEKKLKQGRSWSFYPFKFNILNTEECVILKDFLITNDSGEGCNFYQFSQDEVTREELFKRLVFSPAAQKVIEEKNISEDKVKERFLRKLVFAVNQPNREKLNRIVKEEIKDSNCQDSYVELQERILCHLTVAEKLGPGIIYEFCLLMFFLHDMFLHKNMFFINFDTSNSISVNRKDKITYIRAYHADSGIGYSQLFPSGRQEKKSKFSVNKHFTHFIEELGKNMNIGYFIIYTNTFLDLTEENRLKKGKSKDFYPFKFENIDTQRKKYKILRDCLCIDKNSLYRFSQEETSKLLSLLKLPPTFQKKKEERFTDENEEEMKEKFLEKLIFAVKQPNTEQLNRVLKNEMENKSNEVPYDYEELREIALRWLESHKLGPVTKETMEKLLEDIKDNRSSYQEMQNKNIDEEIKFAKSVVGREGTPMFNQFLDFLIKDEGKKYLYVLKVKGINLPNMSSILNRAGNNAAKAFKDLYDLWFDVKGNKTKYLKTLEKEGVTLTNMSSILNGAGGNAAKAFKELYDLWFDSKGNKTQCLKALEDEGVKLPNMSSILNGAGNNAAKAFKELYDLLFDSEGNKTKYLKTLEDEGVNLLNMSSILNGAGTNAAKAFKDLYDLWFNTRGCKTQYLKVLVDEGISLANMSCILSGAGTNAAKAFEDLHGLWFDSEGNKTKYLKTLEKEGASLSNMSSILSRAGNNAAKAFEGLYTLWFDEEGNKSQYLKTLEEEDINLTNISSILHGAAANAPKAFKELYNAFFDEQGNKKQQLKHFCKRKDIEESFTVHNLSSILNGSGANVKDAFEKLHNVCFDDKGKRTELLDDFYKAGFRPSNLSSALCGAGIHASSVLRRLHSVCFNEKTEILQDFYNAGFRPSDLSCISCRAGIHATSTLTGLHSVCFDEKREKTKLLQDFINVGLGPDNLCNMLSGAADSLKKFHDFCFVGETKKYLNHFLNEKEGFMLNNLSNILHGARANIFTALKDFHDVCFDEMGNKTQLLHDFHEAGFKLNDLSNILSMAGNNASSILKKFHKLCFKKRNYLNHFLAEKNLFSPKDLSKILKGGGMKVGSVFEKLNDLCFDKTGNKTNYLNNLIKDKTPNKIHDVLYKKVRKTSPAAVDYENFSEIISENISVSHKRKSSFHMTEQEQGVDSIQERSSKIKRKNQEGNNSTQNKKMRVLDTEEESSSNLFTKETQSEYHGKKQKDAFSRSSKSISSIETVRQGHYLPSFKERNIKTNGNIITAFDDDEIGALDSVNTIKIESKHESEENAKRT